MQMKPQTSGCLRLHLVEPICYFIDKAKQLTLIDGDDVIVLSEAEAQKLLTILQAHYGKE